MAWFKVDDGFWSHPKTLALSSDAIALWLRAGTWSCQQLTDGVIPTHALVMFGPVSSASGELVEVGYWHEHETGFEFHDWADYQEESGKVKARRAAARERMRAVRGKREDGSQERSREHKANVRENFAGSSPNPDPTRPDPTRPTSNEVSLSTSDADASDEPEFSADVERLCQTLSQLVRANGHKGNVTKQWRVECDRLIRIDEFAPQQIDWVMRWACNDSFWLPNIQSMPKLRAKFTQLKAKALQEHQERTGGRAPTRTEQNLSVVQRLAAQEAEEARLEINA